MTTRAWLNVFLIGLLLVLGLIALYEPGRHADQPRPALTALMPEKITTVTLNTPGETVMIKKEGEDWRITAPIDIKANSIRVKRLLTLATSQVHTQFRAEGRDLAQYDLAQPELRLKLNELELQFGGTEPLHNRRYVLSGSTVALIDDDQYEILLSGLTGLVDLSLLPEGVSLTGLQLPGLRLVKSKQGTWQAQPRPKAFSMDAVNALLTEWRQAQAITISRYSRQAKLGEVVVLSFETEPKELHYDIVAREPELILARRDLGLQYHLLESQAERLLKLGDAHAKTN